MEDRKVNTTQQGLGITPILGVNISPNEDWNIGIKYEHKTYLTLDNSYADDDNYGEELFGSKTYSDIPGIITVGVGYRGLDWLEAQLSFNSYLDKGVGWGGNIRDFAVSGLTNGQWPVREREIDKNYYEIALGLQFNLADNFAISFGGLRSKSGIAESWQSDFSYSNSSFTLGGGIMWKITDRVTFDAGFSNTFYEEDVVEFSYPGLPDYNGNPITSYTDNYNKTTINFAAGLSFSIF
jgi:opacity protein-like surface antigen